MKPRKKSAQLEAQAWESISKKVYWDRAVSLDVWREQMPQAHRSYLPQAVQRMRVREFIYFYGKEAFVRDWPRLKAALPEEVARGSGMYDITWSQLAGGSFNLRPVPQFYELASRQREFLVEAMRAPGSSIYQIAKRLSMQYRRAHDHAQALIALGIVRDKSLNDGKRKQRLLYPSY